MQAVCHVLYTSHNVGSSHLTIPARKGLIVDFSSDLIVTHFLAITIVTCFIRSALLRTEGRVCFRHLKVVLAMLNFVCAGGKIHRTRRASYK